MLPGTITHLNNPNATPGDLAHAMKECQRFIYKIKKHCKKVQITGKLRHLPYTGIDVIEILVIPKPAKNLFDDDLDTPTPLDHFMDDYPVEEEEYKNNIYHWQDKHYHWRLFPVEDVSRFAVAQLLLTGPARFADWLTRPQNLGGALPFSWCIDDYIIYNNSREAQEVKNEKEALEIIGYDFIPLIDRAYGNKNIWYSYKANES